MSASFAPSASSTDSRLTPPRERAFTLHCQGLRSPAIAAQLGIPERTIRAWLHAALDQLAQDTRDHRERELQLAIARQERIVAAAWEGYTRAGALEAQLLETHQRQQARTDARMRANEPYEPSPAPDDPDFDPLWDSDPLPPPVAPTPPAPRLPVSGARYLSLALAAQRELARLQRLYDLQLPPTKPSVFRVLVDYQDPRRLPEPERSAWALFYAHYLERIIPDLISPTRQPERRSAAFAELDALIADAELEEDSAAGENPAESAESATAMMDASPPVSSDPDPACDGDVDLTRFPTVPAPSPEAVAFVERHLAAIDAAEAADTEKCNRNNTPSRRDKTAPTISPHPEPEAALRSLVARLREGTLPPPNLAPPPGDTEVS